MDFTYLHLKGGKVRYNCTIIDLYDRSVVASVNGENITTELAMRALFIAIKRHKPAKVLILHSDQGSQFTSKEFDNIRELDTAVEEFAYVWYNRVRPHTFNGTLTPAAARVA